MAPSPEQFVYNPYTASDADEMARLLGEVFAQSDPPAGAVGLTPFEFEAFVRLFCAKPETQRLTIVARSAETGEMIGALLTDDLASAPPEGMDRLSAKFDPILNILGQLDADYRAGKTGRSGKLLHRFLLFLGIVKVRKRVVRPGKFLHLFLLGVAQRFVGQGVVQQQLVAECLANGERRGYRVAVTTATSKTSQDIFRKQGFVEQVRIAEHGGPILMDKRLAQPSKSLADILAEELDDRKLKLGRLDADYPAGQTERSGKLLHRFLLFLHIVKVRKPDDILAEGLEYTQELPVAEKQARLTAVYRRIHEEQPARSALCLSGGGIRSATFGLGILQGLARCGLLGKFDYLSTVSGGGYIGSWLSAWIKHHPQGVAGVMAELQPRPNSALNPDPQPIRHLRKFSNYLTPKTGLTSVDSWTLIATFIRNMFLNWLVLISLLGAVMMIPRFYLAFITLAPNWEGLATKYPPKDPTSQLNWAAWADSVKQQWDRGLTILLAAGFLLIAVAMAYAIIDVPSTGNARLAQRRFRWFLWVRQVPLLLASLILAAWWAVFRNVHGSEPFQPTEWPLRFIFFAVASYLIGGLLATIFLLIRKAGDKARRGHIDLFLRTGIVLTAAFAGFCLWAMASRIFLVPAGNALDRVFFAQALLLAGLLLVNLLFTSLASKVTKDEDREWWGRSFRDSFLRIGRIVLTAAFARSFRDSFLRTGAIVLTVAFAGFCLWAMATRMFLAPSVEFTLKRDCEATLIPSQQQIVIPAGTRGRAFFTQNEFTFERDCEAIPTQQEIPCQEKITIPAGTDAFTANKDLDAFELNPVPAPANHALNYVCFAPALILAVLLLVNFLFTGLASRVTKDEDREWWGRSAAWILITIFGWILVNVIVLWGAQAITSTTTGNQLQVFFGQVKADPTANAILAAFGGVTGVAGALLALRSKLSSKLGKKAGFQRLLVVVAVVFFVLLSVVISWALLVISSRPGVQEITKLILPADVGMTWHGERLFGISFFTGITLVFGIVMGWFINANTFSLHATYRNRLIRAYLAASRAKETRKQHSFTGFDPNDDFELHKLKRKQPLHVINGALNLVRGGELAWQDRKAESFTMSRLHCGSWHVGYRPSTEYGNDGKGIRLGTALAISGAAANPNMGYHSSPVVGFLMTLFNVRLGWWLGNPGDAGAKTWHRSHPCYSVGPLFSEAMGNTTDRYKYVNLSDGGHFENLGLYEMVLRRCHYIVVSDAGEDPECSFADLGEAIRKIRVDFGIPIDFEPMTIYPRSGIRALKRDRQEGHNCAIGRIRYSAVDPDVDGKEAPDGIIIYIKPACYGDEPRDIYEYFKRSVTFPHESTADQFFSESQFESYRMLGEYTMKRLCASGVADFRDFVREILKNHLQTPESDWLKALLEVNNQAEKGDGHS